MLHRGAWSIHRAVLRSDSLLGEGLRGYPAQAHRPGGEAPHSLDASFGELRTGASFIRAGGY